MLISFQYPSPGEFIRATSGVEDTSTASMLGPNAVSIPNSNASVNMSLLQSLSSGSMMPAGANQVQLGPGIVTPPSQPNPNEFPANWGRCLDVIINSEFAGHVELEAHGLYRLDITETASGKDIYFIEITAEKRSVSEENPTGREPDVYVTISSSDLGNVLDGSLAPLQAYLTGRIQATGDVRKLMFFDKLSRRGHKPGSMFSV